MVFKLSTCSLKSSIISWWIFRIESFSISSSSNIDFSSRKTKHLINKIKCVNQIWLLKKYILFLNFSKLFSYKPHSCFNIWLGETCPWATGEHMRPKFVSLNHKVSSFILISAVEVRVNVENRQVKVNVEFILQCLR